MVSQDNQNKIVQNIIFHLFLTVNLFGIKKLLTGEL